MGACIVGWAHTPFGRLDGQDLENLIATAAAGALQHAGIAGDAVDGVWLGNLNGGFVPEIFTSSLVLQADDGLRWKPAVRLENACASGAAAVFAALDAIEAGRVRVALVVGAEKMTAISGAAVTEVLANCSYVKEEAAMGMSFPGIFAGMAAQYFERHGDRSATLARIAAKNHASGVHNPWAQMRKDLGFEFCNTVSERNPMVAAPLRKTDCSLVSDGAAALVIVHESLAGRFPRAVGWRGRAQVNDFLPMSRRDAVGFEGPRRAWQQALAAAGTKVDDLAFAEVHDCFTIAELLAYEAMGLAPAGQGARVVDDGTVFPGGRLPVNPSGGLKAKGHPIGATGVSMHVLAAMQLCGEAGGIQVAQAAADGALGGVFNMGGSAVANYVSVLRRVG
ncbi:MAG: thiolase domain-containing protein [Aquabacterium sp.]|jgi:acetyl-CoA C-acetyltransferase|nr:MAG: thiolase domain-containing protein [Aquabacterium sp.]